MYRIAVDTDGNRTRILEAILRASFVPGLVVALLYAIIVLIETIRFLLSLVF